MQHYTTETLVDYVNGELPADEDALVYVHLTDCSPCREAYETEKMMREALVEFGQRSEREMPQSLVDAIFAATRPQKTSALTTLQGLLRLRIAVPALGGVFTIAFGFVVVTTNFLHPASHTTQAPIDAAAFLERHSDTATAMPFADHVNAPTFEASSDTDAAISGSSSI